MSQGGSTTEAGAANRGLPIVRDAHRDDVPGMTAVLVDSFDQFPPWETSAGAEGFVEWLARTQDPDENYTTLAELDGMIVGVETRHHRALYVHGAEYIISRGPYAAMHSSARCRGWYRSLREYRRDEIGGVNFSQVAAMRHLRVTSESRTPVNPWTVYVRILRPRAAAARSRPIVRAFATAGYAALALRGRLAARKIDQGDWRIHAVERFDERVDELDAEAHQEFEFHLKRTAGYLNWRFCDSRGGYYSVLVAERGEVLLGYATYCIRGARGVVADLLVKPGRVDIARGLLAAALDGCGSAGVEGVEYWNMANHPYSSAVRDLGFVRLGRRTRETSSMPNFRGTDEQLHAALGPIVGDPQARIHLTAGDSELC